MTSSQYGQALLWPDAPTEVTSERPTEAAYWRGSLESRSRNRTEQKVLGQFMTPPQIARLMADRMIRGRDWSGCAVRLLDPAAGSGVLAAALVEAVASMVTPPSRIELLMCEIDPAMSSLLETCRRELNSFCARRGVAFDCKVQQGDFLLSGLARSRAATVDAVIANPPYFKLSGSDERAKVHSRAVHGQPNIYALFMSSCADLVRPDGAFCFITPRSWANGAYFRALRGCLLERLSVDGLHLFDSRQAHFREDAVLQEALITWASATKPQSAVMVSSSAGATDLTELPPRRCPALDVVGPAPEQVISVPLHDRRDVLAGFHLRLRDLGLKVNTGPVVGFRAAAHLRGHREASTVPMLWMPHVQSMQVGWPRTHRAQHIERNESSEWMLLPNQPMVLLRRFSPKEDRRRITAAPYLGQLPGDRIGVENHLNVIRPIAGAMGVYVALGLAAYLGSAAVDQHLRRSLGSTQVNALELRNLPVLSMTRLEGMGRAVGAGMSVEDAFAAAGIDDRADDLTRHG